MESCRIRISSAETTVCKVVDDRIWNLEAIPSYIVTSLLDLKRVIYEVLCHVIRGDLRHEEVLSLLSDVTVNMSLYKLKLTICLIQGS